MASCNAQVFAKVNKTLTLLALLVAISSTNSIIISLDRIRSEYTVSPPGRPPSEVVFFINPKSGSQIAARIFEQDSA